VVIRDLSTSVVRSGRAPHPDGTEVDPQAGGVRCSRRSRLRAGWMTSRRFRSPASNTHGCARRVAACPPALLWNDTRARGATALADEVGAGISPADRLGSVASFTLAKLRWLRDNEPSNAAVSPPWHSA